MINDDNEQLSTENNRHLMPHYEIMLDALNRIKARFKLLTEKEDYFREEIEYLNCEISELKRKRMERSNEETEVICNRLKFLSDFLDKKCDHFEMIVILEDVIKAQFRKILINTEQVKSDYAEEGIKLSQRIEALEAECQKIRSEKWILETENSRLKNQKKKKDEISRAKKLVDTIRTERDEIMLHLDKVPKCAICLDRQPAVLYQPCCHCVCCESCGKDLSQCPMCRQDIWKKITVFQ